MASLTVENYVKAIYHICAEDNGRASTGRLATAVDVSPGTVTSMLKTLSEDELVTYTPYEGVRLTSRGQRLALRVLRRHRLIELFLTKTLGLTWDEVHEEAENMEHAVSDRLIDRIDEYLGFPPVDPHGDPIPAADLTLTKGTSIPLSECSEGTSFRIARVLDQSPQFLRSLSEFQVEIGTTARILSIRAEVGILTLDLGQGNQATLGNDAARKILVEIVK